MVVVGREQQLTLLIRCLHLPAVCVGRVDPELAVKEFRDLGMFLLWLPPQPPVKSLLRHAIRIAPPRPRCHFGAGRKQFRARAIAKAIDNVLVTKLRAAYPGLPLPAAVAGGPGVTAGAFAGYADLSHMAPHSAPGATLFGAGAGTGGAAVAQLQNARAAAMARPPAVAGGSTR